MGPSKKEVANSEGEEVKNWSKFADLGEWDVKNPEKCQRLLWTAPKARQARGGRQKRFFGKPIFPFMHFNSCGFLLL
jgi:hypothetical protein